MSEMIASPDFVIVPPRMKGLDTAARWVTLAGGRHIQLTDDKPVSMSDAASIQRTANDRSKSKVLQFGQGEGSLLDKQVRMVTNTNKAGNFSPGTLRVEISDATQRDVYERPMTQLPKLMQQLAVKRYSLHTQYFRSPKNVLKAEGKWVTLPTGARIKIHGDTGGGQAQAKPQPESKPQAQAQTVERDESSGASGEGLTHAQRVQIVNKLADKMGIPKDKIEMREQDEPSDEQGQLAAQYDPATDKISVFPHGFDHGKQELIGTLAHEIMHQKFTRVVFEVKRQKKLFDAGEDRRKLEVYNEIAPVFQEDNRSMYETADGQTRYSTLFWNSYKQDRTQVKYVRAVNETLAEVEFLRAMGQDKDIHPLFGNLARRVRGFAESL